VALAQALKQSSRRKRLRIVRLKTQLATTEWIFLEGGLVRLEDLVEEISVNCHLLASMVLTRECADMPSAEKDGS